MIPPKVEVHMCFEDQVFVIIIWAMTVLPIVYAFYTH